MLKYGQTLAGISLVDEASREELEIAYQTLNAIFSGTPDGLIVLDEALAIHQANRAFGRMVELSPEALLGRLLVDALPSQELLVALQQYAGQNTPNPDPIQVEFTIAQPVKRALLANIARLDAGRAKGWIVILHDQSERKRLEYQKAEFVNIAAHELRTPLAAVVGFTELLIENLANEIDEENWRSLEAVNRGAQHLRQVVNELLEFAYVSETDIKESRITSFALKELLDEVRENLQQPAIAKKVHLETSLLRRTISLRSNAKLLYAALYQLMLNGINFNQPDGFVRAIADVEDDWLVLHVIDSGPGIPQAELDAIFNPFFQVEDHNTRHVGGLGLGLSIASRAVRQLGGEIKVASQLGKGSVFTLRMPLHLPQTPDELKELRRQLAASQRQSLNYARHIQRLNEQLQQFFVATLTVMTQAIETRDGYTKGHSERVTALALDIARQMGYSEQALRILETAGRLHDIGKLGTPDALLNKAGPLTRQEYERVKKHVVVGRELLAPLEFLEEVIPIAFSHHERWDGKGYPDGLAGEEIPLGGRILAVADAYHAMTSPRSYRYAIPRAKALKTIKEGAGKQWDPKVVAIFLELMAEEE